MFNVLNDTASEVSPLHKIWSEICSTWAVGLTVIVNVSDSPVLLTPPLSNVGVTTMFATCVWFDEFRTVNAETVPFPLAAKPIDVLSFVQE